MTDSVLVRSSRDGDQFHYLWAARRCLQLLAPLSGIVAITIEGTSPLEVSREGGVEEGEEKIDVAEYHGSQDLAHATLVRYIQLKHSTLRQAHPWTPSELKDTLTGFAMRTKRLVNVQKWNTFASWNSGLFRIARLGWISPKRLRTQRVALP
jgi:hypothetical protein